MQGKIIYFLWPLWPTVASSLEVLTIWELLVCQKLIIRITICWFAMQLCVQWLIMKSVQIIRSLFLRRMTSAMMIVHLIATKLTMNLPVMNEIVVLMVAIAHFSNRIKSHQRLQARHSQQTVTPSKTYKDFLWPNKFLHVVSNNVSNQLIRLNINLRSNHSAPWFLKSERQLTNNKNPIF